MRQVAVSGIACPALASIGSVGSGDDSHRAIAPGSGGSGVLTNLPVAVGDILMLEIARTSTSGDFCGVTLTISQTASTPGACAAGTVGIGAGGPYDVLTINGSTGFPSRRVNVGFSLPFTFAVGRPPTNPSPAHFVIAGYVGVPCSQDVTPLPGGLGTLCFLPSVLGSTNPGAFMLVDTLGLGLGFLSAAPAPWAIGVGGVGFPLQLTFQGLIEETPGVFRTTNAITLVAP